MNIQLTSLMGRCFMYVIENILNYFTNDYSYSLTGELDALYELMNVSLSEIEVNDEDVYYECISEIN